MAKIELSPEVRAIESLIDAREQLAASERMQSVHGRLGRRPEYRYLLCLYEATFRTRPDAELVREVTALVADQPDMSEASALLAELCARTGDRARAELFARTAVDSGSPSASANARAVQVLHGVPRVANSRPALARAPLASAVDAGEIERWFERARTEKVHRRSATYGVRPEDSIADVLLDAGKTVALGQSFASTELLPLCRDSLVAVDSAILEWRRQPATARHGKGDTSRATAAAGFFLAVVLHELDANVVEIASGDGGCKALLPSGAGTRPLLVATAFCDGAGPSLAQSFDRLTTASELGALVSAEPSSRRGSSGRLAAAKAAAPSSVPAPDFDELTASRAEVESAPLRKLERRSRPNAAPGQDMSALAAALATSPVGRAIAERAGDALSPTPASVEALEAYCAELQRAQGEAPLAHFWQPLATDEELVAVWGAFVGEALIASFGGVWECDPAAPSDARLFRVICEDRVVAWPLTQVYLRLKNGPRYDLTEFVAAVGQHLT